MSSTFGGLNTMVRGLYAQQLALNTVGHNVSNSSTPGYSRQAANLATTPPQTVYGGQGDMQLGSGVAVMSITRARDVFVDRQYWKESASLGSGQQMQDTLGKIEGVFQEPSDTGVQTVLNQFWSAWQSLSTSASSDPNRTTVRQRGVEVVNAIQHADHQLQDMVSDINSVLKIKLDDVNQAALEIASLNKQIVAVEAGGTDHANDLRDRRDALVDQLAQLGNVNVTEDQYGSYTVQFGDAAIVAGGNYTKLGLSTGTTDSDYGYATPTVVFAATNQGVAIAGGQIQALIDGRDSTQTGVKGYMDTLSTVSQFLLQDFNAVHRSGYGTDDSTNNNFFGDSGVDYSGAASAGFKKQDWLINLKVNPDLFDPAAGLAKIAAKTKSSTDPVSPMGNASGDNAVLLGNRLKTDTSALLGGASLDSYYSSVIGALGVQSQDAQRQTTNQQSVVDNLSNWRQSTSGVNLDEEMTNMIQFQKGYNAAARVVTTIDEMLDKLINSTGLVGR